MTLLLILPPMFTSDAALLLAGMALGLLAMWHGWRKFKRGE